MSADTQFEPASAASRRGGRWNATRIIAICSSSVLLLLVFVALGADWIAPHDPLRQSLREALQGLRRRIGSAPTISAATC